MRLETSGDNPFTTSAVNKGGRVSVLSNSVRPVPQIQGGEAPGALHALATKSWDCDVFHFHASGRTTLGPVVGYGSGTNDSCLDGVICTQYPDCPRTEIE